MVFTDGGKYHFITLNLSKVFLSFQIRYSQSYVQKSTIQIYLRNLIDRFPFFYTMIYLHCKQPLQSDFHYLFRRGFSMKKNSLYLTNIYFRYILILSKNIKLEIK